MAFAGELWKERHFTPEELGAFVIVHTRTEDWMARTSWDVKSMKIVTWMRYLTG